MLLIFVVADSLTFIVCFPIIMLALGINRLHSSTAFIMEGISDTRSSKSTTTSPFFTGHVSGTFNLLRIAFFRALKLLFAFANRHTSKVRSKIFICGVTVSMNDRSYKRETFCDFKPLLSTNWIVYLLECLSRLCSCKPLQPLQNHSRTRNSNFRFVNCKWF